MVWKKVLNDPFVKFYIDTSMRLNRLIKTLYKPKVNHHPTVHLVQQGKELNDPI